MTSSFLINNGTCTVIPLVMVTGLSTFPAVSPRIIGASPRLLPRKRAIPVSPDPRLPEECHRHFLPLEAFVITNHLIAKDTVLIAFQIHKVITVGIFCNCIPVFAVLVSVVDIVRRTKFCGGRGSALQIT